MINTGKIFSAIVSYLRLRPMSLAGKCRLLFGTAIIMVLVLALLIPYSWMNKLTEKSLIDAGRAVVNTVFEKHFKLGSTEKRPPMLDESGSIKQEPVSRVKWFRFDAENKKWKKQADANSRPGTAKRIQGLIKHPQPEDEQTWIEDVNGHVETTYINIVRAHKQCISCHSPEGTAPTFQLDEPIGAIVVNMPGREISKTVLMNRICILAAVLLAGSGAIVAFYIIAQRIILSPIRQLRAIVKNVSEGNLDVRCGIKTNDEFERLGDALNTMLENLEQGQEKLRQANKQLDIKITELSERNIELFKANKLKGEFLANMSHEFRTPLNAILGFAEILREKPAEDTAKSKRYAENIINSGKNLLAMINDLLEMAKMESGKIELHLEKTSIPELCRGLVAFFSPLTEKQKLKVRLTIDETMPLIKTDAGKVQQILYNLLSNAVKFTPEDGKVEIKAYMPDHLNIRVAITDTGPGIAEKDKEKIFEKFRQIDGSLTRTQPGTGLGLAISTELAKLLSGNIGLESVEGQGATFWLDLPIIRADET
ncbi:MAG: HAMP domain-containing sensor histidine kinase [Phycisphaerales bacterium]